MPASPASEALRPADAARLELTRLSVSTALKVNGFFRKACETAAEILDVERVGIWLFVENRTAVRCVSLYERSKNAHSEGILLRVAEFPAYFQALEVRRSVPAEVASDDPRTREMEAAYLKPLGITSMLDAGVFQNGTLIGIVCHEHVGPPREWTTENRDFASSIADLIALKLKDAELGEMKAILRTHDDAVVELDRLEALGRLAAGAAHDFRNILMVISGGAEMIMQSPENAVPLARQINTAAERGTSLINEMLAFGRQEPSHPIVLDPVAALQTMLPLLRTAVGSRHKVLDRTGLCSRVFLDPALFERVMLNLVLNARDATPHGGTITLALADEVISEPGHRGSYAVLSVCDDGPGIDPKIRERLFEPFATTKPHGSGLGLAIVRRVAVQSGGFVRADSPTSGGATIRLFLPRVCRDAA